MSTATKHCGKCDQDKPATLEYFHRSSRPPYLHHWCKSCMRAYARDRVTAKKAAKEAAKAAA